MRVETDGERRTTGETDDEPGAVADAIDDARGGARAVWTCAYAESRGCVECFNLTLPCVGAARRGCVECLRCARARGSAGWDARATRAAAREGQSECLQYLRENGCPWDAGACGEAARRGHLECLKYLHENGCPWDEWAYRPVAQGVIQDVSDICVRMGVREANGWLIPPRAPLNVRGIRTFMANLSVVRVKDSAGESRSSLMRTRTTDRRGG